MKFSRTILFSPYMCSIIWMYTGSNLCENVRDAYLYSCASLFKCILAFDFLKPFNVYNSKNALKPVTLANFCCGKI